VHTAMQARRRDPVCQFGLHHVVVGSSMAVCSHDHDPRRRASRPEGATRLLRLGRRTVNCSVEYHPQHLFERGRLAMLLEAVQGSYHQAERVYVQGQGGLCPGVNLKKVVMLGLAILSVRSLLLVRCGHTHVRVAG
jgi:hypothetical protein